MRGPRRSRKARLVIRLLAEPSGRGRWRRRATGVLDRWPPPGDGYRTRLIVRSRPTHPDPNSNRGGREPAGARERHIHDTRGPADGRSARRVRRVGLVVVAPFGAVAKSCWSAGTAGPEREPAVRRSEPAN